MKAILATLLILSSLAIADDTSIPLKDAQNIQSFTPSKFEIARPKLKEGQIVKLSFLAKLNMESEAATHKEAVYGNSFFAYVEDEKYKSVKVIVPDSVRDWFLKLPSSAHNDNYYLNPKVVVFGKIEDDGVLLIGTEMKQSFDKVTFSWAGHDKKGN
jgi:hypothetical protein